MTDISTPLSPLPERLLRTIVAHRRVENGLPSTSTHPEYGEQPGDRRLVEAVLKEVSRGRP